jgi:hypothetical protein
MLPDEQLDALQQRFARFASETAGRSPLYERLSVDLARRAEGAALLAEAPPAQRRPNLLYAAVHDLLLAGADDPLGAYYPSVAGTRSPDDDATPSFLAFVADRRDAVLARLRTRATQTNEVGRAAALLPGLAHVGTLMDRRPLALVDLGASAELLLHLDRYAYRLGDVVERLGDVLAEVSDDTVPCVLHSAALAYLGAEARETVAATLAAVGCARDLVVLSLEGPFVAPFPVLSAAASEPAPAEEHFLLGATVWRSGVRHDALLARAHPHGAWLQWLG